MTSLEKTVAVTGGTGFIGRSVLAQLAAMPGEVRALSRRTQNTRTSTATPHDRIHWVKGTLADEAALADLVAGADTVIHIAGLTSAPSLAALLRVNQTGAANVAGAAQRARVRRFILVSSISAREPHLSDYAASKKAGEDAVLAAADEMEIVIVRPPAIIGPDDPATAPMLKAMKTGILPAPLGKARREGRMSFVYMDDIARFLIEQIGAPLPANVLTPHGATPATRWDELADTASQVLSKPVRLLPIPPTALLIAAYCNQFMCAIFRRSSVFNTGKIRELLHNDWTGEITIKDARTLDESLRLSFGMDVDV